MSSAARMVKIWLDVVFVLGAIVCVALVIWLLAAPIAMAISDKPSDVSLRVAIGERSVKPVMPMAGGGAGSVGVDSLRIVDAAGELRFVTTDVWLHLASAGHWVIGTLLALYGIFLLRKILATVIAEHPFATSNVRRMRTLGFLLLGVSLLRPLVEYLVAKLVLAKISVDNVVLSPPISFSEDAFLGGLLLLVLATIFAYGSRLEHEQSLTV